MAHRKEREDEVHRLAYHWGSIAEDAMRHVGDDPKLTAEQRGEFLTTAQIAATLAVAERLEIVIEALADLADKVDRILAVDVHQGRTH